MRFGNIGPPPNFVTTRGAIAAALAERVGAKNSVLPVPAAIPARETLTADAWATLAARAGGDAGQMHG